MQNGGAFVYPAMLTTEDAVQAMRTIQDLAARAVLVPHTKFPYHGSQADADSELADLEVLLSAFSPTGVLLRAAKFSISFFHSFFDIYGLILGFLRHVMVQ